LQRLEASGLENREGSSNKRVKSVYEKYSSHFILLFKTLQNPERPI